MKYFFLIVISFLNIFTLIAKNTDKIVLKEKNYRVEIELEPFKLSFLKDNNVLAPSHKSTSLLINDAPVSRVEILSKKSNFIDLKVTSSANQEANVKISFDDNIACIKVAPTNANANKISLVFGGFPIAHGLGDAGGTNRDFNLVGKDDKLYRIVNDGALNRWSSSFVIFPRNSFAGVTFDKGRKDVTLGQDIYKQEVTRKGEATFYLFSGSMDDIYKNYKSVRAQNSYVDIEPKSRLFELGWESWDALGWNTRQSTVEKVLQTFLDNGYKIKWAVTGSGYWDKGGTTTSFGRFGEKFPDPEKFRNWMNNNDIAWMIGLRTNFVPSGGPFYPKSKKRDRDLVANSFYGNELTKEALEKDFMLKDETGKPILMTSTIFPIVPCYMLDGNIPAASEWYYEQFKKWGVSGIKEDAMMNLGYENSIFNGPIGELANNGIFVMARCGEFTSPGTLLRINDTGVGDIKMRLPINYMQYAACGMPNVYSDVAGVKNMYNLSRVELNLRHTWLLALTSGMAVGAYPTKWSKDEQDNFKQIIDFHYSLVPYLYSAAMNTYENGYPYTLTPMTIAYPDAEELDTLNDYQWMIGQSIIAVPIMKTINEGRRDIYLPEGVWYDFQTNKKYVGSQVLKDVEIKTDTPPCFVGGDGIIVLRDVVTDELRVRIYDISNKRDAKFFKMSDAKPYLVDVRTKDIFAAKVKNSTTNELIKFEEYENYIEFRIVEGDNYTVK